MNIQEDCRWVDLNDLPVPSPEEIDLGLEEAGAAIARRRLEEWVVALEKRRAFLLRDSREIAGIEARNPRHAEVLAQQLAENRAQLRDTEKRLEWVRYQLAGRN